MSTAPADRLLLHKIDGLDTGLLDHEPPTPGPLYTPRPGYWLNGRCWVDDDGRHVWFAHDCAEGRVATMLPWPTWQVLADGRVAPSIDCRACGLHANYPVEWTPYGRAVIPHPSDPVTTLATAQFDAGPTDNGTSAEAGR